MIIYRPHKGSLEDALKESREFKTIEEMKAYICEEWTEMCKSLGMPAQFDKEDIVIDEETFDDERCGWHDSRHVCIKRLGKENYMELYGCPQCIGTCATEYKK